MTKISKNKKQSRTAEDNSRRLNQIFFSIIALIVILSMVITALK